MVEAIRGGGLDRAEIVKLEERPRLLSQSQVGNTTPWMSKGSDLVGASGRTVSWGR